MNAGGARPAQLSPGDTFAGFRVERRLGEGGMGAIYVVTQLATGRLRALKLMHPGLVENGALREKFMQEARIGARIESEHVVDVVGAGIDEATGAPWLAMELLEGEDLAALLTRKGRIELPQVLALVEQMGHAMGAAHAAGIVHRDLKPENVFLARARRTGDPFTVKILDFGIAKLLEEARTSSNTGVVGSPFWMAPEQTERRAVVRPSADVWALGLIVYRLLTGRYFWLTAEDEATSVTAFLRELVLEPIPPASARAAAQGVLGALPPGFDAWFARCVVRDPAARFAEAGAAVGELLARYGHSGDRRSALGGTAEPRASNPVVAHGPSNAGTAAEIATARTIADVQRMPSDEPPESVVIPTHGSRRGLVFLGAGALVVALGGIAFALRGTAAPPPPPPPPPVKPVAEVRCPADMVPIAGGSFAMGSNDGDGDEKPVHTVKVDAFCIDVTEVTAGSYATCAHEKGCAPAATHVSWSGITPEEESRGSATCNGGHTDRVEHPMNCVSWEEAEAYCRWAKKRLPSEEEWEYAARGTEGRVYPWGMEPPSEARLNACGEECARAAGLEDRGAVPLYHASDGWVTTAPVRSFGAGKTSAGVYDLAGNVWEWTSSAYCPYGDAACTAAARVTRGGAWNSDARSGVRSADRDKNAAGARANDVGFRCAL